MIKYVTLAAVAAVAALSLTGCGTPGSFSSGGIRDEVSSQLPAGWKVVKTTETRDAGNCVVTCIGRATFTLDPVGASPQESRTQLDAALSKRDWRREAVNTVDPATRTRYPLSVTYSKDFDDRSGKSGSYELIPMSISSTAVTIAVTIDAHDLK